MEKSFKLEFVSIIFESSSAPLDPIESSQICNSSNESLTWRAEARREAPLLPILDSTNIISFNELFLLRISESSFRHCSVNLFFLKVRCFIVEALSRSKPRLCNNSMSHVIPSNSKFLRDVWVSRDVASSMKIWESEVRLSLVTLMFMEVSVSS
ncbi:hypothetical protein N665_4637s0001 [Sinapis alba]|nr:hypothetical protein N665_4637s0001 [Sinapis alba]